jgi:hypothetical protein
MGSDVREFGEILGFALNLCAQFFIWRYLLTLVMENGDKQKYSNNRIGYFVFSMVLSIGGYGALDAIARAEPGLGMFLIVCIVVASVVCAIQWKRHPVNLHYRHPQAPGVPNPVSSPQPPTEAVSGIAAETAPLASIVMVLQCSSCSKPVFRGAKFCPYCGVAFKGE